MRCDACNEKQSSWYNPESNSLKRDRIGKFSRGRLLKKIDVKIKVWGVCTCESNKRHFSNSMYLPISL